MGNPVTLADGSQWYLPQIDWPLIFTSPELRAAMLEARRRAAAVRGKDGFSTEMIRFQVHLANLGAQLLMRNYNLTVAAYERLLHFESVVLMFTFTQAVSAALHESRPIWESQTGTDGDEFPRRN